jgi:3-oxoacyl-[acyl-carrier protein] reductase
MDFGIKDKVALVAAASRGLGRAAALQLAREGCKVAVCSRSKETIMAAAKDIADETNTDVSAYVADVTNEEHVKQLAEAVIERFGSVDILVTNSGGPPGGMASDFTVADYRKAAELNLMSTISMCHAVLPTMKKNQWGRIVAVTSVAARQPIDNLILSNTVRAGVLGYCKTLSAQVATEGITVNAVCPGYTRTERVDELAMMFAESGRGTKEEFYQGVEVHVPMKRMGTPEEFGNVVAFLASERASYVTGVALPIDGGWIKGLY